MAAYQTFAQVYDILMDNVPYEEWARSLAGLLKEYGIADGLVLDLGCGTGTMTELLSSYGYDMIGVDNSPEMLDRALEKRDRSGHEILYLMQEMTSFELYGTVRAVVSVCDSLNYLLEEQDLLAAFRLVNNYLDPGGLFVFDMNTVYKYREVLGDGVIAENREDCSFIWENSFFEEEKVNEYDLTLFLREENDLYRRVEETHYQKAYDPRTVVRLLEEAGLSPVKVCEAYTGREPDEKCERLLFVARECTKKNSQTG